MKLDRVQVLELKLQADQIPPLPGVRLPRAELLGLAFCRLAPEGRHLISPGCEPRVPKAEDPRAPKGRPIGSLFPLRVDAEMDDRPGRVELAAFRAFREDDCVLIIDVREERQVRVRDQRPALLRPVDRRDGGVRCHRHAVEAEPTAKQLLRSVVVLHSA